MRGVPSKRELVRRWQADQGLVRVLMPLLESALDLAPEGAERSKIEATYALAMERWKAAQDAIEDEEPRESRVVILPRRRF